MSRGDYVLCVFLLICLVNKCFAVIYHLNDSEYDRMPPLFALDDYEPCLRPADGVYCMLDIDLYEGSNAELMAIIRDYSEHSVKHYNHSYIQRGVCLQQTCPKYISNRNLRDEEVLFEVLEECLNDSIRNEYGLEAKIKLLSYCDTNGGQNKKDVIDWIVVGIFAAILILNLLGTSYDIMLNNGKSLSDNQYLLSFSVIQNWQFLTTGKPSDPRIDRLKGLHGYRTVTIFLMIVAHVMWINSIGFTVNTHDFEKAYENIGYQLIFNGMMIIHIFFIMSGFLLAYNLIIRAETKSFSCKMYPKLFFLRWCRLTAPYAVVLAFTSTWLRHIGGGPLWRLWVTDSVVHDCRSYWWLHLLYVQNYVAADKFCMIQTWYLGAEMQVFAVSLFLFLLVPSQGRCLLLSLQLLVGLAIPALQVWLQDLHGVMVMEPEFYRKSNSDTFAAHILGHNSLASYTIGMGTAVLLYRLQQKEEVTKKSKILQVLTWCIVPAMLCLFLTGTGFYADGPRVHLALRVVWAAGHRLIMGGIVAFGIISLVMRFSECNCAVLEWSGWVVPSRLAYCVYLVHLVFVTTLLGTRAYLTQVSLYNMVIVHLGITLMSYVAALPLYLLVEAPTSCLIKLFTTRQ